MKKVQIIFFTINALIIILVILIFKILLLFDLPKSSFNEKISFIGTLRNKEHYRGNNYFTIDFIKSDKFTDTNIIVGFDENDSIPQNGDILITNKDNLEYDIVKNNDTISFYNEIIITTLNTLPDDLFE